MTKKIDTLTQEQKDKMPEYVNKWQEVGLSTAPLDYDKAKEAARLMYKAAGLPEPTQFFVADSPIDAIRVIQELDPDQSESQIFSDMMYGCHDASWCAFYDFFEREVGVDFEGKLDGLRMLAESCGWVSMYEDVVVFQHRPEMIKFDDQDRLHNEFGPAIRYRDGLSIYVWHGVQIPAEWIEDKENLSPDVALNWSNVEQRRCACEILGWAKILESGNVNVIDTDDDPEVGELVEFNLPGIGEQKFLRVRCGTGREFALPVPPEMTTALEANAWTYGFSVGDFALPEVRT